MFRNLFVDLAPGPKYKNILIKLTIISLFAFVILSFVSAYFGLTSEIYNDTIPPQVFFNFDFASFFLRLFNEYLVPLNNWLIEISVLAPFVCWIIFIIYCLVKKRISDLHRTFSWLIVGTVYFAILIVA